MRVSITGEKPLIQALQEEIKQDQESKVERLEEPKPIERSELPFVTGVEVVTIISVVNGVVQLVKLLLETQRQLKSDKQKLHIKTALGTKDIELSKDITAEELQQQLSAILGTP